MKNFRAFFFEKFEPKDEAGKRFVKKHIIAKTSDANGNKDDIFNAKNIKPYDRHLEHGYNQPEDETVYEDVEPLDELSKRKLGQYVNAASKDANQKGWEDGFGPGAGDDPKTYGKNLRRGQRKRLSGIDTAIRKLTKEETESLDELSGLTLQRYISHAASNMAHNKWKAGMNDMKSIRSNDSGEASRADATAKEHERKSDKRYGGINRAANKLARKNRFEEIDLQELSARALAAYLPAAVKDKESHELGAVTSMTRNAKNMHKAIAAKRTQGIRRGFDKWIMQKEDITDTLDEMSKEMMARYIHHATRSAVGNAHKGGQTHGSPGAKDAYRRTFSRVKGIDQATARLGWGGQKQKVVHLQPEETQAEGLSSHAKSKGYNVNRWHHSTSGAHGYDVGDERMSRDYHAPFKGDAKTVKKFGYDQGEKLVGNKSDYKDPRKAKRAINRAMKTEDKELQELSKPILARYAKRAVGDVSDYSVDSTENDIRADRYKGNNPDYSAKKKARAENSARKATNRYRGVIRATDRLAKEDVDLQELSDKTLGRYIGKAAGDMSAQHQRTADSAMNGAISVPYTEKRLAKGKKREAGINAATRRLAAEEAELQELSSDKLHKYIDHAITSVHNAGYKSGESFTKGNMDGVVQGTLKSFKRHAGIARAARKLQKKD